MLLAPKSAQSSIPLTVNSSQSIWGEEVQKLFPTGWCNRFGLHSRNQEPHSENIIVIKSPKPPLVLGPPPRLAYPLVVFLIRETETDEISHPDDTVRDSIIASTRHLLSTAWVDSIGQQVRCTRQQDLVDHDFMKTSPEISSLDFNWMFELILQHFLCC